MAAKAGCGVREVEIIVRVMGKERKLKWVFLLVFSVLLSFSRIGSCFLHLMEGYVMVLSGIWWGFMVVLGCSDELEGK